MTTPVHATSETDIDGENEGASIFRNIHWAPPVNSDIGTDLVTCARDTATPETHVGASDLRAPVFMQVKGSRSENLKPTDDLNGEPG